MAEEQSAPASRRRTRATSGAAGTRSTPTTRRRRMGGVELVDTLNEMVSQLIKENRSLKRQLARLAAGQVGVSMLTQIRGSSNAKAKAELGWVPAWASWRQGFRQAAMAGQAAAAGPGGAGPVQPGSIRSAQ